MSQDKRELLVVLDLETTGLDPDVDEILELAFIVVDNATLTELMRFSRVVRPKSLDMMRMHPKVVEMHSKSGLLVEACDAKLGIGSCASNAELLLATLDDGNTRFILTGNTVHFDRSFLKVHAPALERLFYHRHADVSAARTVLGVEPLVPVDQVAHRALADCEMSLAELRKLRFDYAAQGGAC